MLLWKSKNVKRNTVQSFEIGCMDPFAIQKSIVHSGDIRINGQHYSVCSHEKDRIK
jgi:hypothetical protein